jgi:hypothetical protein
MAHVIQNPLSGNIAGKIGGLVFVHRSDGRTVVRRAPPIPTTFSAPQLKDQRRFAQAVAYFKRVKTNPELYANYQQLARETHRRACDLAIADFLNAPEITQIDLSGFRGEPGDRVLIHTSDQTGVQSVQVAITNVNGTLLEQGVAALEAAPGLWRYTIQSPVEPDQIVLIQVTAADLAGNSTSTTVAARAT